ncbi:MAG: M14 family metallopeptidase [Anaerolineales bacterium]|jgi:murein tripeptide amidase MpaA|nr:M14 family metallopeptidase [Anaerolineales bacterium]
MDFNRYFTNDELESTLQAWCSQFDKLCTNNHLGTSYEGRAIHLLTLTNFETGSDLNKPAVWIDANIHATELTGTTAALFIAHALLNGYGSDPQITALLDTCTFYIVPRINPDGAAWAMSANPRYIRSGVRPYPWGEREDGLHDQDIDKDGRILQMRIEDPHGDWKVSSLDPRLMEKRAPDEFGGKYYRLLPEGLLKNFDGDVIKLARSLQGLDFNRNFPYQWRPEAEQRGAGPYPASEPEIHAMLEFITRHPNINHAITFHTFSRALLRPYSTKSDDEMDTGDLWVYKKIGEIGSKLIGYRCVSTFHDFKYHPKEVTTGAFDDWMYDHLGIFALTIELWDLPTEAGIVDRKFIEWFREHPHTEDLQILKWIDQHAPEGYVEWYAFQHPQLGPVELGGWNPLFTWGNPPPALVSAEVSRHLPFIIFLAKTLPHLAIHKLEKTRLSETTYRVRLVIENSGFLPTFTSNQGKTRQAARPVRVELKLPENGTLLYGKLSDQFGHLQGRSNKQEVNSAYGESPTDHRAALEWVIQCPKRSEIEIKILSERAGSLVIREQLS